MAEVRIDLDWWPPPPDEPIGEARALELVAALKRIAGPVVEEAVADLRQRIAPGTEIAGTGAPAAYLARIRVDREMASLGVGRVYQVGNGDPASNSIQLHRDGRLTWRRD